MKNLSFCENSKKMCYCSTVCYFTYNFPFETDLFTFSCACVVKNVVKCSFEYLSVVHHTRRHSRQHNVGFGEGEITNRKWPKSCPWSKRGLKKILVKKGA